MIADYNNDQYTDILFGNQAYGPDTVSYAYIYWNSRDGFDVTDRDSIPTRGVDASVTKDLGNVYTRSTTENYYSSVFDASRFGDSTAYWKTIRWEADTVWTGRMPLPRDVSIGMRMHIRTGNQSGQDTLWSDWLLVENGSAIPGSLASRYVQYKITFSSDFKASIALDRVEIRYQLFEKQGAPVLSPQPNPFKEGTSIIYEVPSQAFPVQLNVYDASGRLVRRLLDTVRKAPGFYAVQWDGNDVSGNPVSSGTYFLRMQTGHFRSVKKLILLR